MAIRKKSVEYFSKKVLSAKEPVDKGVQRGIARDSFIGLEDYREIGVLPKGGNIGEVLVKFATGNYMVEWATVSSLLGGTPLTGVTVANTLFVSNNGNDTTALRERLDLPYATVLGAMNAAQQGDTVIVFAGEYTELGGNTSVKLVKNGVGLYCYPGVIISINNPHANIIEATTYTSDLSDVTGGIYGQGIFRFNSITKTALNIGSTASDTVFTFEAEGLYLDDTDIVAGARLQMFSMSITKIVVGNSSSPISVNPNSSSIMSNYYYDIDHLQLDSTSGSVVVVRNSTIQNITVNIGTMTVPTFIVSPIRTQLNTFGTRININVNTFKFTDTVFTMYPIVLNGLCSAIKNISIGNISTRSLLFEPSAFSMLFPETGKYMFRGWVFMDQSLDNGALPAGSGSESLIDFRLNTQSVEFNVDLVADVDFAASSLPTVLNISKRQGIAAPIYDICNSRLTGEITVLRNNTSVTTDAVIQYGRMAGDGGLTATYTAVLSNLTIVTDVNQPCLGTNDAASTAVVPVIKVYSNRSTAVGINTPTQVIEIVNTNIHVK